MGAGLLVAVSDRVDPARVAVVDVDAVGWVVGGWVAEDGGRPSRNVESLVAALRRGDWSRVHAIADYLSVDVDAVAAVEL